LRSAIERAGGRPTERVAGRVAREITETIPEGYRGQTGGWKTEAAAAAQAWEYQNKVAPETLKQAERDAYKANPASLYRNLDSLEQSPFRNYLESWIGAYRKGNRDIPMATELDSQLRGYGEYKSPYDRQAGQDAAAQAEADRQRTGAEAAAVPPPAPPPARIERAPGEPPPMDEDAPPGMKWVPSTDAANRRGAWKLVPVDTPEDISAPPDILNEEAPPPSVPPPSDQGVDVALSDFGTPEGEPASESPVPYEPEQSTDEIVAQAAPESYEDSYPAEEEYADENIDEVYA